MAKIKNHPKREKQKQNNTLTENLQPEIEALSSGDLEMFEAYISNGQHGTKAWMGTHPEASYDSARVSASRWLSKANIQAAIDSFYSAKIMSLAEAMGRTGDIARANLFPFIRIDPVDGFVYFNFADPLAKEYMHIIKKIKTKRERKIVTTGEPDDEGEELFESWEGEWVEVELHDAQRALHDILNMYGKFTKKLDLTSGGKPITWKQFLEGEAGEDKK